MRLKYIGGIQVIIKGADGIELDVQLTKDKKWL